MFVRVAWLIFVCLSNSVVLRAQTPATQPDASSLALWLAQLADSDEEAREEARINLMGLTRDRLPELRRAVESALPLEPSQSAALRDIVTQVYLSGEGYETVPERGFLGLRGTWPGDAAAAQLGLLVVETMPGFCAFRMLQSGDLVIRVAEYPQVTIRDARDLSNAIVRDAGRTVHLDVLRRGQVVRVPIVVDARPAGAEGEQTMNQLLNDRRIKSEKYFNEQFAPLLEQMP